MDFLAGSRGDDGLRKENQRLRARLQAAEASCRRAQQRSKALEHRLRQTEASVEQQVARLLRKKEHEWMVEADRNVHALLEIIRHHEETHSELEKEVQDLKTRQAQERLPAVEMVACSTQTESACRPLCHRINGQHLNLHEAYKEEERRQEALVQSESHAYMQQLFEQLQVSTSVRERQRLPPACSGLDSSRTSQLLKGRGLRRSPPKRDFRASVIQRLGVSYAGTVAARSHRPPPIPEEDEQEVEQDAQVSGDAANAVVKDPSISSTPSLLQQDLAERNRLLQERLASQQKVLDQLLQSRLDQAVQHADPLLPVGPRESPAAGSQHGEAAKATEKSVLELATPPHDLKTAAKTFALLSTGTAAQRSPSRCAQPRPLSPPIA